jgi:uncharacterized Zn finger protein (UPF0148 family)
MANQQTRAGRRYCEECGRPIENRDPDVYLCGRCAQEQEEEEERSKRAERDLRKRQRSRREVWADESSTSWPRNRSERRRPRNDDHD